jgi:RNA polymerase sigma factor (TIGR02999 family)
MSEVTLILARIENGETTASAELLPLVYDELRQLAAARMLREIPGQTLEATALVHEAYVRLVDASRIQTWNGRGHFFSAAAEAMRRILVERARQKASLKGGGQQNRIELIDVAQTDHTPVVDLLALDDALQRLKVIDPRKAELVKLRFFTGLTIQDAAKVLGISPTTADNDWAYAKCWLRLEMSGESD